MTSKLDQSLDDVIKSSGTGRRGGRGGSGARRGSAGRRSSSGGAPPATATNPLSRSEESNGDAGNGSGPIRRQRQGGRQSGPYQRPDNFRTPRGQFDDNAEWKHDLHQQEQAAQARLNADKIYVSNLDSDVNEDDVKEIFGKVGKILKVVINFNQHGKSLGTAEVTFARKGDAEKAVAEYDVAEVDGRPMAVKLVGTLVQPRVVTKRTPPPQPQQYPQPYQQRQPRQGFQQQRPRQSNRGGGQQRQGGQRGQGRGGRQGGNRREKTPAPTLESLDAELDSYHTKPSAVAAGQPSAPGNAAAAGQPTSA